MTQTEALGDRSVPRRRRRAGETARDGRGRHRGAPAILHYGFRPFFLAAALYAALAIPLWLWMLHGGLVPHGPFSALDWHIHEMLFGFVGAVMAGFILTAVPNWTGRLPLSGWPLAMLVLLWAAGRVAMATVAAPVWAMGLDLAFPLVLATAVWVEVVAGRNWRNAPIAVMLTLFGLANALHHGENLGLVPPGSAMRLALAVIAMLLALIGGRIVPSFTRNWLVKHGSERLPARFGRLDKAALLTTGGAAAMWAIRPELPATGVLLAAAGVLLCARLARWRGLDTADEPIVLILHMGYLWLALSFLLLGASVLLPLAVPASAALHALTAGAIGTMTLAVMTRASLGHTGRDIVADGWTSALYLAVTAGAALRVAAPFADRFYMDLLIGGGGLWSLAFALFALRYGPILCRPGLKSARG